MQAAKTARFNGCLQAIGILCGIASFIGLIMSALVFFAAATPSKQREPLPPPAHTLETLPGEGPAQKLERLQKQAERRAEISKGTDTAVRGFFGMGGAVSGFVCLVIFLGCNSLLLRKKVWRCPSCQSFVDRL